MDAYWSSPNLLNARRDRCHGQEQHCVDHDPVREVDEVEEEGDEGYEEDNERLGKGVHDVRLRSVSEHHPHKGLAVRFWDLRRIVGYKM